MVNYESIDPVGRWFSSFIQTVSHKSNFCQVTKFLYKIEFYIFLWLDFIKVQIKFSALFLGRIKQTHHSGGVGYKYWSLNLIPVSWRMVFLPTSKHIILWFAFNLSAINLVYVISFNGCKYQLYFKHKIIQ